MTCSEDAELIGLMIENKETGDMRKEERKGERTRINPNQIDKGRKGR